MAETAQKRKIALYGRSGSGKSFISRYLVEKHGFTLCSTGLVCRSVGNIIYGNNNRSNLNAISSKLRDLDQYIWINSALRNVSDSKIVFESIRYIEDVSYLQELEYKIWHIDCPIELCTARLRSRGQVFTQSDLSHAMESILLSDFKFDTVIDNGERDVSALTEDIDAAVWAL